MKAFEFVAFDSSGKNKLGTVKAWSLSEAKRKIKQKGFYLASIKDSSVKSGGSPILSGFKSKDARVTDSHSQNYYSFLKYLKEFFFCKDGGIARGK